MCFYEVNFNGKMPQDVRLGKGEKQFPVFELRRRHL